MLDNHINSLQQKLNAFNDTERDTIKEFDIHIKTLQNAGEYYRNDSYVQKRKITEILFSNIVINNKKRLTFQVKPYIKELFIQLSGGDEKLIPSKSMEVVVHHYLIRKGKDCL